MSGVTTRDALVKALNRGVRRGLARSSRHPSLIPAEVLVQEVERAILESGAVVDASANVVGRASVNDLRYAAVALEGSGDNGDRYCAARLHGLVAALSEDPS